MLPANAKDYVKASPHLLEYLHTFPVNLYGIPLFLSELKKDLRSMESPNIIYPVNETTFVHILPDPDDVRNYYIPIEPSFLHSVNQLLPEIETKLINLIDALEEKLTNMRASGSDDAVLLEPPRAVTLELALEYIEDDELIEVTPKAIRLRKRSLTFHEREKLRRAEKKAAAE